MQCHFSKPAIKSNRLLNVGQHAGQLLVQVVVLFLLHLEDVVESVDLGLEHEVALPHGGQVVPVFLDLAVQPLRLLFEVLRFAGVIIICHHLSWINEIILDF